MGDISVDNFLETLKQLLTTSNLDFTIEEQYQLEALEEEIKYLKKFLKFVEKRRNTDSEVKNLVVQIRDVVFDAENVVGLFIVLINSKGDHASNSLREHKDHLFVDLERVEKDVKNLKAEVKQNFDMMGNISLHFFLETTLKQFLKDFAGCYTFSDDDPQLRSFEKEIIDLRGLLNVVEKKHNKHSEVMNLGCSQKKKKKKKKDLGMQIEDVISIAEKAIKLYYDSKEFESNVTGNESKDRLLLDLERAEKDIQNLKFEVTQICNEILIPMSGAAVRSLEHSSTGSRGGSGSLGGSNPYEVVEEKVVVGFEEEVAKLVKDLLDDWNSGTYGWSFKSVSIVGPGGCGKTTLAKEVFDQVSTAYDVCAWVVVSQDYDETMKRDLLIDIFKSFFPENHRDYEKSSEPELAKELYDFLHDKKYLLVMDNIWGTEAWADISPSFPKSNYCLGRTVVFNSRIRMKDVPGGILHLVKPLSQSHSWKLLEVKVFGEKHCPPELVEIGKQIATKCEGLPLAIVTIARILATGEKILSEWQQIAEHVSSIVAKECMKFLELSYNHLPQHLKACFLYIGALPEAYEISVRELEWLWIAEGFIQQSEKGLSLEAIAEDYFLDLIDSNLITIARRSFIGKIKTCRVNDVFRELCLEKAREDNFFAQSNGDDSFVPSAINKHRRLFISRQFFDKFFFSRPFPQNLHSFLCLGSQHSRIELYMSFFAETFKLLRVFSFIADECRGEILRGQLVHLRYLAVQLSQNVDFPLPFHLFNLETLTVQTSCFKDIKLSSHIFKMVRLRHLYTKQGIFTYHVYDDEDEGNMLGSLHTLHRMCICEDCARLLERTPNLRELGLIGDPYQKGDSLFLPLQMEERSLAFSLHRSNSSMPAISAEQLALAIDDIRIDDIRTRRYEPASKSSLRRRRRKKKEKRDRKGDDVSVLLNLKFLKCLEILHVECVCKNGIRLKLPGTLTQLTLKQTNMKWEQLSILLDSLPGVLKVLKLLNGACSGPVWDTTELKLLYGLKYLKLEGLDITEWKASEDQLGTVEILVIRHCKELKGFQMLPGLSHYLREITVEYSTLRTEIEARVFKKMIDPSRDLNLILRYNAW